MRFSPAAWAKLLYFRDAGGTEIGGFGVSAADDLLYIEQFATVRQEVTMASVAFDDTAVADFFDKEVDAGHKPEQFGRIWCHTHPGNSPHPSSTDEATFARVFGKCQWAVMAIIAQEGRSYARLRFNIGPGGEVIIPVEVDYSRPFPASAFDAWQAEYEQNIRPWTNTFDLGKEMPSPAESKPARDVPFGATVDGYGADRCIDEVTLAEIAEMDPAEREFVLAEFGFSSAADDRGQEVWL